MAVDGPFLVGSYSSGATNTATSGARPFTFPTAAQAPSFSGVIPVGATLLVGVTFNASSGVANGTVSDTKGNTYTLLTTAQCNVAGALTRTAVYLCKVTTQLVSADRWTFTHDPSASTRETNVAVVAYTGLNATSPVFTTNTLGSGAPSNGLSLGLDVPGVGGTRDDWYYALLFAGSSDGVRWSSGSAGVELYDASSSSSATGRTLAAEGETVFAGSPDPYTISGTWASATNFAAVAIMLQPVIVDAPPTADAGPNHYVKPGRATLLDGSGSRNATKYETDVLRGGPERVTYAWTQVSGPSVGAITPSPLVAAVSNAGMAAADREFSKQPAGRFATYTVPAVAPGTALKFRLTVTNDKGLTSTKDVTHTVGPVLPRVELQLADLPAVSIDLDPAKLDGAGTTPTLQDPLLYLDGLQLGWRYADPTEVVRQLEPMTARVQLSTPDVANLEGLEEGLLAKVLVLDEYRDHVASVYGRVGELTADQSRYVMGDGSVQLRTTVSIEVVDHLASTNPATDDVTRAAEIWSARWNAIAAQLLADDPDIEIESPTGVTTIERNVDLIGNARAVQLQAQPVLDLFRANLYEMPLSTGSNSGQGSLSYTVGHYLLAPVVDAISNGELDHVSLHVVPSPTSSTFEDYFPSPHRILPPVGHPHRIAASRVELAGTWRRLANKAVNAVVVKQRNNPDTQDTTTALRLTKGRRGRVVKRLEAAFACKLPASRVPAEGAQICRMHLPEQGAEGNGWDREGFTYRPATFEALTGGGANTPALRRDQATYLTTTWGPLGGCWFPDWRRWYDPFNAADPDGHSAGGYATRSWGWARWERFELAPECFLRPVLITGIPAAGSLSRSDGTYVGHLTSAQLTITGCEPRVTFELERTALTDGTAPRSPTKDPNGPF